MKTTLFVFLLLSVCIGSAIGQADNQRATLPTEPGMYVQTGGGFTKIIGQIAQFTRTGSRLVSGATVGIKSAKVNIQLAGPHAEAVVSPQPTFYFIPPKQEAAAGVNAGDFILIRLEEKSQRRQFEIGAAGLFRASSGISLTHQIQILRSEPGPGVYMITTAVELSKGEYALYLARGEGLAAYVYDFGVQGSTAHSVAFTPHSAASPNTSSADPRPTAATEQRPSANPVTASVPKTDTGARGGGVLGITGADWEQGGVKGVEITDVSDDSSAQLAGLCRGCVITDVNGAHIHSTQDLASFLGQTEPGSRVTISYLYRSNLGWMPKETVAILSKNKD